MVSCHGYYNVSWRSSLNATKKDNEEFLFIPSTYILLWWINTDKKKKITDQFQGGCPVFAFSTKLQPEIERIPQETSLS